MSLDKNTRKMERELLQDFHQLFPYIPSSRDTDEGDRDADETVQDADEGGQDADEGGQDANEGGSSQSRSNSSTGGEPSKTEGKRTNHRRGSNRISSSWSSNDDN